MTRKYGLGQIYRRGDIWWIDYLCRGIRYRESTGSTRKQDASRLLKQRITEIHSDTFVSPTEQRLTVYAFTGGRVGKRCSVEPGEIRLAAME